LIKVDEKPSIKIVISYRRQDAPGAAGRLHDSLAAQFGRDNVFLDIDAIRPGVDWVEAIEKTISSSDVVLPLIGPYWLAVTDETGQPRLKDPNDVLRFEIESALKAGLRIIPIQVHGAPMPKPDQLPESLVGLTRRQSIRVDDDDYHEDVKKVVRALETIQREKAAERARADEEARLRAQEHEEAARKLREEQQGAEAGGRQLAEEERRRDEAEEKRKAEADDQRPAEEAERRRAEEEEGRRTVLETDQATWGRRLGAFLLDVLVVMLAPFIVFISIAGDAVAYFAWIVLPFIYFTALHGGESGQTLGKRWLGIRVVNARTGRSIGYGAALGRYAVMFVFGLLFLVPLVLDALWPLWDQKKQALHDKIVGSVVVKV
jgi:uncharacterized RDD family membrane protein YckC